MRNSREGKTLTACHRQRFVNLEETTSLLPPFDGGPQAGKKFSLGSEAERNGRPFYIETASRLSVWLCPIPRNASLVANQILQRLNELPDRYLASGTQVDRIRIVVLLGSRYDRASRVVDVKKFAARGAVAPNIYVGGALVAAWQIFRISAGMTCDEAGSKLSPGPYRLTGRR